MVVFSPYTTSSWSIYAWVVVVAFSLSTLLCRCCCFSLFAIVCFFYHKLVCFFFSFVSFFLDIGFDLLLLLSVRRRRRRRHRSYLLLLLVITLVSLSFYLLFSCVGGRQLCVVSLFYINYEFGWINFHLRSSNSKFQVKQNVAMQLATVYLCAVGIGRLIVICSVFCYTYKYTMLKSFRLHSYFFSWLTGKILSFFDQYIFICHNFYPCLLRT